MRDPIPRPEAAPTRQKRILVVFNPLAGNVSDPEKVEKAIRKAFSKYNTPLEIILLESSNLVSQFILTASPPYDLVVAAGGDGTVSGVADSLVGHPIPIGILPLGTGNVLAKSLGIPQNLEKAVQVIASSPTLKSVDAMLVNGKVSLLNTSAGITSHTISAMRREDKHRMGMFAYVWRGIKVIIGFQPHRFHLEVDDHSYIYPAAEVLVANPNFIGVEPFYWGDDVFLDDGCVDLFVIRGRTIFDLLAFVGSIMWFIKRRSPLLLHIQAHQRIRLDVETSLPVQVDGDLHGLTPVEIQIHPSSLQFVVPKA